MKDRTLMIGGAVVLGLVGAYLLATQRAPVFAQPAPSPGPAPVPALPGPGVPVIPGGPSTPAPLPPAGFPVGARAMVVPFNTQGGRVSELRKRASGIWVGYTEGGGQTAGNVWQTIGDAARDPRVAIYGVMANGAAAWTAGQMPLESYA